MPLTKVSSGVIAANAVVDSFGTQSITGDKLGLTAINANNIVNASITASQLATSLNLATNNVQVSSIQSATGTPAITFAANGQMTLANTPLQLTGGQIVFPEESMFSKWLHNYTVFAVQRRLYLESIPVVILPVRI